MDGNSTNQKLKEGFVRGAAASKAVIRDIQCQGQGNDFLYGYLANQIAGVLGYAAARLGHEGARSLLSAVTATFEAGIHIVESSASGRVQ